MQDCVGDPGSFGVFQGQPTDLDTLRRHNPGCHVDWGEWRPFVGQEQPEGEVFLEFLKVFIRRHDIQYNDTQHDNIRVTQDNDTDYLVTLC
jgi:hypothetical protein